MCNDIVNTAIIKLKRYAYNQKLEIGNSVIKKKKKQLNVHSTFLLNKLKILMNIEE